MDTRNILPIAASDSGQAQLFFVDGHKITVRYSEQDNPTALRLIRDTLINSISCKK